MHRFLQLSATDRHLLVQSALLLGAIDLALWLLPFQTLRRFLRRMTQKTPESRDADQVPTDRVTWAVTVASRYTPMATCLAEALAAQALLGRYGHPASLRIGVARHEEGQLQAHAWVESQGKIVIGGSEELSRYTPLPPLEGESP